jgi:DNA gyrase/topoisomerase IV subunit A
MRRHTASHVPGTLTAVTSEREQAEQRLPIIAAVDTALRHPQEVLELVQAAEDDDDAIAALRKRFGFTDVQATVVMDAQWRRLTAKNRRDIADELSRLLDVLAK